MSSLRPIPAAAVPGILAGSSREPAAAGLARTDPPRRGWAPALRALAVWVGFSAAGADGIDEYQLKAAFLSKFAGYVTWPEGRTSPPDAPFVVGVLGADPFGRRLDETFAGRKLGEHPIDVRRFPGLEGVAAAHVLFVPRRESQGLAEIARATEGAGVLLVGESSGFALGGGVINFTLEAGKLRFEINTDSARRQGLKVSSDLLKLARIVTDRS